MSVKTTHIAGRDLEAITGKVMEDGGNLRLLSGSDHGLTISVMHSTVMPGSGPKRHRHPHAEVFVLHDGQARYEVEGAYIDAEAGDIVIVPPNAWHGFVNTGTRPLSESAIHESPRAVTEFEDGTQRR